ncbi:hypothetical protein QWJ34_20805 [Saccharibacillus sp. CPCC 101409]|uniref:hypothetical protein n=1 Tax=Saccharibacillus sp. CPCC 101409 TaxID=3058041 RepID=UPI002672BD25|nr:hypothetical protein [Saccharibacillus sp. CPCC 101409]MDO3412216.1 hypothetical protein [Saccharibacillus sp. CPCC 101409]
MKFSDSFESSSSSSASASGLLEFVKRNKRRLLWVLAVLALIAIPLLIRHFNTEVFYLDNARYKQVSVQGDAITYDSALASAVTVQGGSDGKEVSVEGDTYRISRKEGGGSSEFLYTIAYPDGQTFSAESSGDTVWNVDENGEPQWITISAQSGGKTIDGTYGRYYPPSRIVSAAYPQFHEKAGNPVGFVLFLLLAAFGWCCFYYRGLQNFLFQLSAYRIWVKDPEPNDFYYAMSRVTGIAIVAVSVFAALMQL